MDLTINGGGNVPIVLQNNQNNATVGETEVCPTLPASMGMGGGYVPMIVDNRGGCWTLDEKMGQTYIHNNCANTLAARDYKQPQAVIMTYQNVAGTLNPGGHPGSYNGQDAYNDMLVTDGIFNSEIGNIQSVQSSAHSVCAGLQGRNRPHNRGGR